MTTETREDYIRAIWKLKEKNGAVKSKDVAEMTGLAKSTISERLRGLKDEGLVTFKPYTDITLTKKGEALAAELTYKHRLIEVFLHKTLGMPINKIHDEANRLEHAFSDESITHLARFLGNPKKDPHGSPLRGKKP